MTSGIKKTYEDACSSVRTTDFNSPKTREMTVHRRSASFFQITAGCAVAQRGKPRRDGCAIAA